MYISHVLSIKHIIATLIVAVGLCMAQVAFAATLTLSPTTGVYTTGAPFTVSVLLNTQGQAVNASEGVLSFNPKELQVLNVSRSGSIFNLWTIEPTFSNSAGTVSFGGGSPRGYTGGAGRIMSITFMPKNAGTAAVSFSSGSALAADGQGTNVLRTMSSGSYTVAAKQEAPQPEEIVQYVPPANTPARPELTSTTHADPDGWHTATEATITWELPDDVVAVRTALDDSPSSVPVVVYDPPIDEKTLEDLEEGVQYFHLQFKNENGWGKVAHFRLAVDTQAPSSFEVALADGSSADNPQPTLQFTAEDATSLVQRFMISVDGGEPVEFIDETGSSTFELPRLEPGSHTVVVEAFDEAGNSSIDTLTFDIASFEKPTFENVPAQIAADVVPVLLGVTRPGAVVSVTVTPVGGDAPVGFVGSYEVTADDSGRFRFIPDGPFLNGVYEITAAAVDTFGAQSDPSDPVRLVVTDPGFVKVGSMLIGFFSILIPLGAMVLLFFLGLFYLVARMRKVTKTVVRETKEAEETVEAAFRVLDETVAAEVATLAGTRKSNKLTKAETVMVDSIKSDLAEAKKKILKEVSDVDDVVS